MVDAPAPSAITFREGAGLGGTDIVEITWPDDAIKNTWLEVTMLAGENTGLAENDVFYFGSRVGDTGLGNSAGAAITSAADQLAIRTHPAVGAGIDNPYDFDRNGVVSAGDELTARFNPGILLMLNLPAPASPSAAPLAAQATIATTATAASNSPTRAAVASTLSQRGREAAPAANIASEPLAPPVPATRALDAVALAVALDDESEPLALSISAEGSDDVDSLLGELLAL